MKDGFGLAATMMVCAVLWSSAPGTAQAKDGASLATPRLVFRGTDSYEANGFDFVRYQYDVTNKARYPKSLFATSPDLPPCGQNANPSRIAVEIYDTKDKRITEFCSLPGPDHLGRIWFAVPEGTPPPSGVYLKITDRGTGRSSRSKVAPTSKP